MSNFIIDASVVFKWYSAEKESFFNESQQIYQQLKNGRIALFAPSFLLLEITNVFFWKRKFDGADVELFLDKLLNSGINFSDCPAKNSKDIFQLMQKYELTAYDALYLWLAKDRGLKLISVDDKLMNIKDYVINPSEVVS